MSLPSVTVGIPVYNGADYLDGALASLCGQSFADLQIIVSDNASTDATPDIIAAWAARDPRIRAFRQPVNIGAFANFEWVLRKADTEFFMFAAHDDLWSRGYVESLHAALAGKPGARLAVPLVAYMDIAGRERERKPFPAWLARRAGLGRIRGLFGAARGSWFYGLYRREPLLASWAACRDFGFAWSHDFLILLPFFLSGEVAGSNDAVISVRVTDLSAQNYRPKTHADQKRLFLSFLKIALQALRDAPLTGLQRVALLPSVLGYANRRGFKVRRILRSAVRERFSTD